MQQNENSSGGSGKSLGNKSRKDSKLESIKRFEAKHNKDIYEYILSQMTFP